MIAVELMRIVFSALPTGPTGLRIPRSQLPVSNAAAAASAHRRSAAGNERTRVNSPLQPDAINEPPLALKSRLAILDAWWSD
jgi:hypothetical protein